MKVRLKKLFVLFVLCSIILLIASLYFPVFADRMNYFLIPIQLHLVGNLDKFIKKSTISFLSKSLVVFFYLSIYLIWFNFGNFSHVWKNYDIYITNCTSTYMMEFIQ